MRGVRTPLGTIAPLLHGAGIQLARQYTLCYVFSGFTRPRGAVCVAAVAGRASVP